MIVEVDIIDDEITTSGYFLVTQAQDHQKSLRIVLFTVHTLGL